MRTCIKAWMSSNFGQTRLLTTGLAALVSPCESKNSFPFFSFAIDLILFKLARNEDIHSTLDQFKFQPAWITDCGASCH